MSKDKKPQAPAVEPDIIDKDAEVMDVYDDTFDPESEQIEEEKDIINKQMNDMNALTEQLEQAKADVEKEKKEYLYLMAEFDTFRRRTVKEKAEIMKNASEGVFKDLLPIVDDFERAIEAGKQTDDPAALKEGTDLIYNKLVKFMEKNGVKPIESTGADFDADRHEAIAMVPGMGEDKKGKVIDTVTKGYTINDKVLRHAKVAVGQ